ncbi:MAG: glycosyltransferase family 2 protein [Acidobacteria bacterium]|nr:glycosyltransferase family 2 protein [Acidobacteriota bacterium]
MKLVMTLLVRDEEDILDDHLHYHLAQGVDRVIVTDNLSTDATPQILDKYQRRGLVYVIREEDDTYMQRRWVTRMARLACQEFAADWVIHSDADEFWWPLLGDLKETIRRYDRQADVITARRFNFVPRPSVPGPFYEAMLIREVDSRNPVGRPLPPKVCHRAVPDAQVSQGNHRVRGTGLSRTAADAGLEILHFPLRTYEQFANKIARGGRAYERNRELPPHAGRTWRQLFELSKQGRLRGYFDAQVLDEQQIARGMADGQLVRDTRLSDYFQGKVG